MEPISLILAALLAGASKAAGETAATAVKDAYAGLRAALKRRFAGQPAAEAALEQYEHDPQAWQSNVEVHLRQAGLDQDAAVLEAARLVMDAADPEGARAGRYVINLTGAQGIQVGDRNTQTNYFGPPPTIN